MVGAVTGIGVVEAVSGRRPENANTGNNRAFNWLLLVSVLCRAGLCWACCGPLYRAVPSWPAAAAAVAAASEPCQQSVPVHTVAEV